MSNFNSFIGKFFSNLPLYSVIGLTAMTTGVASFKLLNNTTNALAGGVDIAQISLQEQKTNSQGQNENTDNEIETDNYVDESDALEDLYEDDYFPIASFPVTNPSSNSSILPSAIFTIEGLALHNKPGDCYIGYNGIVYNVSNNPSWLTCNHHGIVGGIDITSRFPHSTSYFNSLPKMGTLIGGQTSNGTGGTGEEDDNDGDDDSKEDHNEQDEVHSEDGLVTPVVKRED